MCTFEQLPAPAFTQICQNLPCLEDIFNLQSTSRKIHQNVKRCFWYRPKRLQLTDGSNALLFLESGQMFCLPAKIGAIEATCKYATRLTEFDLVSDCRVDERFLIQVVEIIRNNVQVVNTLQLSYFNPDFMYLQKNRSLQTEDSEKQASPSLSAHKKICKLISEQSENLKLLHIRINSTGHLAIGRHQEGELHIEFNCEEMTQNVMLMLHQVFNGYTMFNNKRPHTFFLGLNFTDVERLKNAFIFCTHSTFPAGHSFSSSLKEIHCRVPTHEMVNEFDFNELRAQLRSTLKRIVWYTEDWNRTTPTQIKTLISEIRPPKHHEDDLFESPKKIGQQLPLPELPPLAPRGLFLSPSRQLFCAY